MPRPHGQSSSTSTRQPGKRHGSSSTSSRQINSSGSNSAWRRCHTCSENQWHGNRGCLQQQQGQEACRQCCVWQCGKWLQCSGRCSYC